MSDIKNNADLQEFDISPVTDGTITSVPGVLTSSCHCGIRKFKDDFSIIFIPGETACSAVFTKNKFAAAPVIITKEQLSRCRKINAVLINSGIANACTGVQGIDNARKTIKVAAEYLNLHEENIIISSTGRIGRQLPLDKIEKGIAYCSKNLSLVHGHRTAKAILTIDKHPKEVAFRFNLNGKEAVIGGIAKGSVMVEPDMATTLSFIATDARIDSRVMDAVLKECVEETFNCISTDGCQSTNDMIVAIAGNSSEVYISEKDFHSYNCFRAVLMKCLDELSRKVVEDAEGATKFVELMITGSENKNQARQIGKRIANSILFKTAMYGEDINWGRIAAAIGSHEGDLDPFLVDISIDGIFLMKNGMAVDFDIEKTNDLLKNKYISFNINLNSGNTSARILTSDISYEYIKINALYKKQQ
jgi:glutamate N-acetyltransferase/amino-acid N-acetyltransferase